MNYRINNLNFKNYEEIFYSYCSCRYGSKYERSGHLCSAGR